MRTEPAIPDTLLDTKLNLYRLQRYYRYTEWYGDRHLWKLTTDVTRLLKPSHDQIKHRWLQIFGSTSPDTMVPPVPTGKKTKLDQITEYLHQHSVPTTTESRVYSFASLQVGQREPSHRITNLFYFDQDIIYFF